MRHHPWHDQYADRYDDPRVGPTPPDAMRAANADREAAAEQLKKHHADGRLTDDEFQQRLEQSMAARTFGELRALTADLPADDPAPARGGPGRGWRRGPWGLRLLPAFLLLALAWSALWGAAARHAAGYGAWHHGYGYPMYGGPMHHGHGFPWLLVLLAVAGFVALRRRARYARYARFLRAERYWGRRPRWV